RMTASGLLSTDYRLPTLSVIPRSEATRNLLPSLESLLFRNLLEHAQRRVLPHAVPGEAPSVHRDVDAGRQDLHEGERASQVEEPVRASERVRDHRPGQDDRLLV